MSFDAMLSAQDDAALEAIANKGLLRRARKDLEKAEISVTFPDTGTAELRVDTETVNLDENGPARARCTCPSNTVCKHILVAVLRLQETRADATIALPSTASEEPQPGDETPTEPVEIQSARTDLINLSNTEIRKFAGKDFANATALLASLDAMQSDETGSSLIVTFPDDLATVTFIAGQSLKGAVCKGPVSKTRLLVTAAALFIRGTEGLEAPAHDAAETASAVRLDPAFLTELADTLERIAKATLSGTPELAEEQIFDLAISARAQAAPRLSSQLRQILRHVRLAIEHHIDFSAELFLSRVAETYALALALTSAPDDPSLTGVLKRDYQPVEGFSLRMFGADPWHAPSGARGLTLYGFSPDRGRWYTTTTARAAGMDPSFSPLYAYHSSLWSSGSPESLMGRIMTLTDPLIANGNEISYGWRGDVDLQRHMISREALVRSGALTEKLSDSEAFRAFANRTGLKQPHTSSQILLVPKQIADPYFDEIEQRYFMDVADHEGDRITLAFGARDHEQIRDVQDAGSNLIALLIDLRRDDQRLTGHLVSFLEKRKDLALVRNVGFPQYRTMSVTGKALRKTMNWPSFSRIKTNTHVDPVSLLLNEIAEVPVLSLQGYVPADKFTRLISSCDRLGLTTLCRALERLKQTRTTQAALAVTYLSDLATTRHLSRA